MRSEEKEAKSKYDKIARYYHHFMTEKHPKGWFANDLLERPATLELVGNVHGKEVLDFGCGTGIMTKILKERGAKVKGFDISSGMLEIAKTYLPGVEFKQGTGNKIPFNEKFDLVVASLVVDYFKDLRKMLKEVRRVLKNGGFFVFSQGNPIVEITSKVGKDSGVRTFDNYFKERKIYRTWENVLSSGEVKEIKMPRYHRTYEKIIKDIVASGFEIADYKDACPLVKAKKLFPDKYARAVNMPLFCVWKVKKR